MLQVFVYSQVMKTLLIYILPMLAVGIICSGCGNPESETVTPPPGKGNVQTAVEGFTGKTAVDCGLKAKEQIKKANEAEMRDRTEAMQ
jgi:hypothetical protein